jgi:hypothetical protein
MPHIVRFYGMNKITCKYEYKYFARPNLSLSLPVPPACYQMTAVRIARELWCINQKFSSVNIIPPWLSMIIYHLGTNCC